MALPKDAFRNALTWATFADALRYSPAQPRRPDGKWGSGGGSGGGGGGGETMSAIEADDALQAAGFYGSDLTGVDEAVIPDIVSAATGFAQANPDVMENMSIHIGTGRGDPRAYASTSTATYNGVAGTHGLMRGQASVYLNPDRFKDGGTLRADLARDHASGWIAGGSVQHVVRHELAHVVDGARGFPSASSPLKAISKYGLEDASEAFAEAFATGIIK